MAQIHGQLILHSAGFAPNIGQRYRHRKRDTQAHHIADWCR